jgi:hypothetical protein
MFVVDIGKVLRFQVCRALRQKEDMMCIGQHGTAAGHAQYAEEHGPAAEHDWCSQACVDNTAMRHVHSHEGDQ